MKQNKLILGTVQFGLDYGINNNHGKPFTEDVYEILNLAFDRGVRLLDTANAYGNAVSLIGNFHELFSRKKFKIISKFYLKDLKSNNIYEELKTLKVNQYYAYLFHSFDEYEAAEENILFILDEYKKKGLINKVGVSVYTNDQFLKAINDEKVELIQFPYNLLDNWSQKGELIKLAKDKGKETHARSVFLQGLFYKKEVEFPDQLKPLIPSINHVNEIAKKMNDTINNVALNYVINNPLIDFAIIGVDSKIHLLKNLEILLRKNDKINLGIFDHIKVTETDLLNPVNWKKI